MFLIEVTSLNGTVWTTPAWSRSRIVRIEIASTRPLCSFPTSTISPASICSSIRISRPVMMSLTSAWLPKPIASQALVKDIITGLFILIEDQIAVGDIVDVGKDHRGTVEAISIRTIRLRDQAGIVHTVPFSEVTSIKNLSKEFAYAVTRIAISYSED